MKTKTLAALAPFALLAGCVSLGGGEPPDQLISLTPAQRAPAGEMGAGKAGEALVVLDPDTDRRLDVLRVPVQIDGSSIAYVKDAVWVEKPARQFRRLLAETMRAKTGQIVIEGSDFEVTGKTIVSGRLLDMGYDAQDQAVIVRYDAVVTDGSGTVRSRRFEARVPGIAAESSQVAPALNSAANDIAQEVADWLVGGA
ncbi:MAG: ABC-type transport auxiliary lipoprotein family protein [Sphingomonadaceae bacterium]